MPVADISMSSLAKPNFMSIELIQHHDSELPIMQLNPHGVITVGSSCMEAETPAGLCTFHAWFLRSLGVALCSCFL